MTVKAVSYEETDQNENHNIIITSNYHFGRRIQTLRRYGTYCHSNKKGLKVQLVVYGNIWVIKFVVTR